jgi:predicted DNA-binding protein
MRKKISISIPEYQNQYLDMYETLNYKTKSHFIKEIINFYIITRGLRLDENEKP